MIKIDLYHQGASARVRLHHHPYAANDGCGPDCDYEATERAYQPHKGNASDYRKTLVAAVVAVCLDPAVGHHEWSFMVGEQQTLDLGIVDA